MSSQPNANPPPANAPTDQQYVQRGGKKTSSTTWIAVVVIVVAIIAVVAVGAMQGWFTSKSTSPGKTTSVGNIFQNCTGSVEFSGAGSTFVYPIMSSWASYANQQSNGCLQIAYSAVGSGTGISDLTTKTVDFGASDAPLSSTQTAALPAAALTIPDALGAVSVMYNLGVTLPTPLNLTGSVIAQIYQGNITNWDDPQIAALNHGDSLPNLAITTVHRLDGSGTTFVFTNFLSQASPWWKANVGSGLSVSWPNLATTPLSEKGSTAVAGTVVNTKGAIGYAELNYAKLGGVAYAAVANPAGNFILPNSTNTLAAAQAISSSLPAGNGNWANVSIVNQAGAQTYPLATLTYLMVYADLGKAYGSSLSMTQAQWMIHFIWWAVTAGQSDSTGLFYVPLPPGIVTIDETTLHSITYNGQALVTP
jgi:phosphate ABC transporter phosphate-binding protein